jgi:chromosome segregation ATPase
MGEQERTNLLEMLTLVRADIERAEKGLYRRIDELKERQDTQNGRVNRHEAQFAAIQVVHSSHGERLTAIDQKLTATAETIARIDGRTQHTRFGLRLTARQRAAVWTGLVTVGGILVEMLHQLSVRLASSGQVAKP